MLSLKGWLRVSQTYRWILAVMPVVAEESLAVVTHPWRGHGEVNNPHPTVNGSIHKRRLGTDHSVSEQVV